MLERLWMSISCWKDPGAPKSSIGDTFYLNCLIAGMVKAVYFWYSGLSIICQNLDVKLMVEKMVDPGHPILSMHSCTSLIEYLSTKVCWLIAQKSCRIQTPSFLATTNMNMNMNMLFQGLTTPSFNSSFTCCCTASCWFSWILNRLTCIVLYCEFY